MVNLMTGLFLLSLDCTFGCGEFYERRPRVPRLPVKCSVMAERLINTVLERQFVTTVLN
jgi:hypothetical protein